jgi:hypothetical protein
MGTAADVDGAFVVAWMLVDELGHRKARRSVGLSNVELRGAHAAPQRASRPRAYGLAGPCSNPVVRSHWVQRKLALKGTQMLSCPDD